MNFREYCEMDSHLLLILQDEFSSHFEMQVSLLPYDYLDGFLAGVKNWFNEDQIFELREAVSEKCFFEPKNLSKWHSWIAERAVHVTETDLIDFSGESPALQILRTNHAYRAIETTFIALAADEMRSKKFEGISCTSLPNDETPSLRFLIRHEVKLSGFLIVGPAFILDQLSPNAQAQQRELILPFSELASPFLDSHEKDRLVRYSVLRSVITLDDAKTRIEAVISGLFIFDQIEMDQSIYGSSIVRTLIRTIFAHMVSLKPNSLGSESGVPPAPINFQFPVMNSRHGAKPEEAKRRVILSMQGGSSAFSGLIYLENIAANTMKADKITPDMSRAADQAHTTAIDQRLENLLVFRGWVFDHMGEVASFLPKDEMRFGRLTDFYTGDSTIVEAIACAWLWKLLRADTVTFYRFDHREQKMHGEAWYGTNPKSIKWARDQSAAIESMEPGSGLESSYLFKACTTGLAVLSIDGIEAGQPDERIPTLSVLENTDLETPSSFFVLPVQHGGRVFGAIECVSFRAFAFDEASTMLVDEFSELLGKYFVAQANSQLLSNVRKTTVPNKWHLDQDRRFDDLAVAVADYFLVHSASVWRVDTYDQNRMVLEGTLNRSFSARTEALRNSPNHSDKGPTIDLTDPGSITAMAMEDGETIRGEIGISPFDDDWAQRSHRKDIVDAKMRYVAIMPIRTVSGEPIASFTLFSRYAPFNDDWIPQFDFCSRTIATALSDFALFQRVLNDGLSDTTHEISQIAIRLRNASKKIQSLSFEHPFDEETQRIAKIRLDDIREFSDDLLVLSKIMTPAAFVQSYSDATFRGSPLVNHFVKSINLARIRLKWIVNREIETLRDEMKDRGLEYTIRWRADDNDLWLDERCTVTSIRNVLENAVKYAPKSSDIVIDFEKQSKGFFSLRVSGFGPEMSDDELNRIFVRRFRGENADERAGGRGEGLYQTKRLMEAQRGAILHQQDREKRRNSDVWQTFRLKFRYSYEDEQRWGSR